MAAMSAVLLAVFSDYRTAESVHVQLSQDGFPADRVELTARNQPGRAALGPAEDRHGQFLQYFRTLFDRDDEREFADSVVTRIEQGAAMITVHVRGEVETTRATELLLRAGAEELAQHDLDKQGLEYAAAPEGAKPWVSHLLPEGTIKS